MAASAAYRGRCLGEKNSFASCPGGLPGALAAGGQGGGNSNEGKDQGKCRHLPMKCMI